MRHLLVSVAAAASLVGCGIPAREGIPEGSRRVVCATGAEVVPVKVLDASGQAVANASIKAVNLGTGESTSGATNDQGASSVVTAELGSGTVRVTASFGAGAEQFSDVTFTCGECNCIATPSSLTFSLK